MHFSSTPQPLRGVLWVVHPMYSRTRSGYLSTTSSQRQGDSGIVHHWSLQQLLCITLNWSSIKKSLWPLCLGWPTDYWSCIHLSTISQGIRSYLIFRQSSSIKIEGYFPIPLDLNCLWTMKHPRGVYRYLLAMFHSCHWVKLSNSFLSCAIIGGGSPGANPFSENQPSISKLL